MKLETRNKLILIIDYYKKDENDKFVYDGQVVDRVTRKDLTESFNEDLEKGIKHQLAYVNSRPEEFQMGVFYILRNTCGKYDYVYVNQVRENIEEKEN